MPKKKKINPLVEHITDFSDMEYDDVNENIIDTHQNIDIDEGYDDSDHSWMLNYNDECDTTEEVEDDLWDDEPDSVKETGRLKHPMINHDLDQYMSAAVWFHEMSERGGMTKSESRYVELMVIELANFYFGNLDKNKVSKKGREAVCKIFNSIKEAGICCSES